MQHEAPFEGDFPKADADRLATRERMLQMGIDVFTWPLFDVRVTHMSPTSSAVHIAVSLFLMDAMSDLILRQELSALYRAGPGTPILQVLPPPAKLAFKDYCTALDAQLPLSDTYQRARKFWLSRLSTLSSGPELPLLAETEGQKGAIAADAAGSGNSTENSGPERARRFINHHRWLTAEEWGRAKANCAYHAVTVPAMLLACYSIMLARYVI